MIKPSSMLARISHTILPLALGLSLAACTPAQIGTGVQIGVEVVRYTCAGARKLCEWTGNEDHAACRFLDEACTSIGHGGESPPVSE